MQFMQFLWFSRKFWNVPSILYKVWHFIKAIFFYIYIKFASFSCKILGNRQMSIAQFDIKSAKKGRHWIESSMEAYIKTFKTKHWDWVFFCCCCSSLCKDSSHSATANLISNQVFLCRLAFDITGYCHLFRVWNIAIYLSTLTSSL